MISHAEPANPGGSARLSRKLRVVPQRADSGYDLPRCAPAELRTTTVVPLDRRATGTERDVTEKSPRLSFAARRAQARFEPLLRPHLDYLYKLAYRFTGTSDRAEDLVQDLLVRVYPRCDELLRVEQLRPWLARVMYRLFVDQWRHERRVPHVAITDTPAQASADDDGDPFANVADSAPGPQEEIEARYDRENLNRAWERLSPEHRAVLTLFEIEGYTLLELEQMLEVSRGTLKSRLHRARCRLAQLLTEMEPSDRFERVKGK
jgi:RNA polymerase sigma-70 factor (ECF subfamily)